MGAALALAERTRGATSPNPNVGCVIVRDGHVVGRGWTRVGGRPHAEAIALAQAGEAARGAVLYASLEPCAHASARGPDCTGLIIAAGVASVVTALTDPDPRTNGNGHARMAEAGIVVASGIRAGDAMRSMAGFLTRARFARPFVTLKLAMSLDGCIALADGSSRWITGPEARAHAHIERSRHEAILVGRGTYDADQPTLDVRLPGLEGRSPLRVLLTKSSTVRPELVEGPSLLEDAQERSAGLRRAQPERKWQVIGDLRKISSLPGDHLLVEGGAGAASAFLAADLVDRLLLYRAPILIGGGKPGLGDIGLTGLADAHGRWALQDSRILGTDRLDVYERVRG